MGAHDVTCDDNRYDNVKEAITCIVRTTIEIYIFYHSILGHTRLVYTADSLQNIKIRRLLRELSNSGFSTDLSSHIVPGETRSLRFNAAFKAQARPRLRLLL